MLNKNAGMQLGLGLIGIGRSWGYKVSTVPEEQEVIAFLNNAMNAGITFFDTAPAYGVSEVRFGNFLKTLDKEQRSKIVVATKFGEFYDEESLSTYVDHSYKALCKSVDKSIDRLGVINILQLHKTNPEVLKSADLLNSMQYAKQKGINVFGASVSDIESGRIVCENDIFSVIQIPYNIHLDYLEDILELAKNRNKFVIINRPFNMGEMMYKSSTQEELISEAFKFITKRAFHGVILTGTKSIQHLQENIRGFQNALEK
ncbi:MAG: hypothetical protein H6Q70_864 [Firmicutes bacterium]|nr:hypothetical protein [Bacillota bacterium]